MYNHYDKDITTIFPSTLLCWDRASLTLALSSSAAYARSAARSQPLYAQLAEGTMKNAYNVALGDWFNPPVIQSVERRGETIRIQASDDVMVTSVEVMILDKQGKEVEKGEAIKGEGDWWEYMPRAEGKVVV